MAELEMRVRGPASGGLRCDGQDLVRMLAAATAWLEPHVPAINALNVFPVPDGDTGTNMFLTLQAALKEVTDANPRSLADAAQAIAYGSLMGARGNSGVILSQILRGLAVGLEGSETMGPQEFTRGLRQGAITAYQGVMQPVEGTMLTVVREAATVAEAAAGQGADLIQVLERTWEESRQSVARTIDLLDVLHEAGVVDAGGEGLAVILEGFLRYLKGEATEVARLPEAAPVVRLETSAATEPDQMEWGYCTEFIIQGPDLDLPGIRETIAGLGNSVLVVGDRRTIKVHVHTFDPGRVLGFATQQGVLHKIKIDNMEDQHHQYLLTGQGSLPAPVAPGPSLAPSRPAAGERRIEVVAVASGEGLRQVFQSLGALETIAGGQTMNPSTQEILGALESMPSRQVILLPNNKNIWMAAEQARQHASQEVRVLPTQTIPQGVAALLAFNPQLDLESNFQAMRKAMDAVHTLEVSRAIRSTSQHGVRVRKGDFIAILDDRLVAAGKAIPPLVRRALAVLSADHFEIITLYYGDGLDPDSVQELADDLRRWYPQQQVETVPGGQPHYPYIISVE